MNSSLEYINSYPDARLQIFHISALGLQQLSHNEPEYGTNIIYTYTISATKCAIPIKKPSV